MSRLCHLKTLWVEEAYPMVGALQMWAGQVPFRDFWYDKPPLLPAFYALIGGQAGWPLRMLDVAFVLACCYVAFLLGREWWGERAGGWSAGLLAFFLTFDHHSVVMAIAPDAFLLLPHLGAIYLAQRQRAFAAGLVCALGIAANLKGAFVIPICLLFAPAQALPLLAGCAPALFLLVWPGFREQVLVWGQVYAGHTFVENPLAAGLSRTAAWLGFHAALVGAAACRRIDRRFALWLLLMAATVTLGWRFFPRYYFAVLPPLVLLAGRALAEMGGKRRLILLALLLVPLGRFGPRYVQLAMGQPWGDLALYDDAVRAVEQMPAARSVFVWGYRPEINVLAQSPSLDFYIESQPLTGVFADRHLTSSLRSATPRAARIPFQSEYIVDGLGPLNPRLAIPPFYLVNYEIAGRTPTTVIYRRR